jgi:hypothetical protein
MSRVIVQMQVSLDGYVAARGYPCGIVATRYRPRVTG